jgi:hypothetical protein
MSRNTARLFRHDRAAISAGLSSCSTVTSEWIKSINSDRDLCASAASSCWRVFPRKFIRCGTVLAVVTFLFHKKRNGLNAGEQPTRINEFDYLGTVTSRNRKIPNYFRWERRIFSNRLRILGFASFRTRKTMPARTVWRFIGSGSQGAAGPACLSRASMQASTPR